MATKPIPIISSVEGSGTSETPPAGRSPDIEPDGGLESLEPGEELEEPPLSEGVTEGLEPTVGRTAPPPPLEVAPPVPGSETSEAKDPEFEEPFAEAAIEVA